ncbi:phytoene/squalene synthase family protein [Pseudovibrio exalbescens]|uniref:phytoene/squalene synthase family protein n=1 Tax=Pseudovibrio exalbescens TaxID=197461 RepID=UPI0023664627|nr:phytoene/squalene synthase family protein [Pseudovibrio exalbescens]MDD7911493.1 phytoene/squalene synthase family protein [Pseudovibrio exalbescens]
MSSGPASMDVKQVLRAHGRSFALAERFLGARHGQRAAQLYALCRWLDDIADRGGDANEARRELALVRDAVRGDARAGAPRQLVLFFDLKDQCGLNPQSLLHLIDGLESDLTLTQLADEPSLIRYAYRVAGTVGVMMCALLDVTDRRAYPHAIDLGIAMQLTNIARDIREDAERGRIYLPKTWTGELRAARLEDPPELLKQVLKPHLQHLLGLADTYYASGYSGLAFLPRRARFAMLVAGRVYQEIGRVIEKRAYDVWEGRAVVGRAAKGRLVTTSAIGFLWDATLHRPPRYHVARLHDALDRLELEELERTAAREATDATP